MTNSTSLSTKTVGQLVSERPQRGRVFEHFGIDYCCGGRKSLLDACAQKGLDPQAVSTELDLSDAGPADTTEPDWNTAALSLLADHIESTHHRFMRDELPRAAGLVRKVAAAHGQRHPALVEFERSFQGFAEELLGHMNREDAVLFPWIRDLEAGRVNTSSPACTLQMPISRMMHEHDDAGAALQAMRDLTDGFTPPSDACGTYRVMLSALKDIEADMHVHVHKENNILFPRAIALEATRR